MILPKITFKMFPLLDRNLPHVEEKILSYLEPKDLAAAMVVSKQPDLVNDATTSSSKDPTYESKKSAMKAAATTTSTGNSTSKPLTNVPPNNGHTTSSQVSSQSSYKMAMENIIDDYG